MEKPTAKELLERISATDYQHTGMTDVDIANLLGWKTRFTNVVRGWMYEDDQGVSWSVPDFFNDYNAALKVIPKDWSAYIDVDHNRRYSSMCHQGEEFGEKETAWYRGKTLGEAVVKAALHAHTLVKVLEEGES